MRVAEHDVLVVSTPFVSGQRIDRVLGLTWGLVVRSRGIGYQVVASLRSVAGGEIKEFTDLLDKSRHQALLRLREHAAALGANAVVSVAFDSSQLSSNMTEVLAYGTAVVVVPEPQAAPVRLA